MRVELSGWDQELYKKRERSLSLLHGMTPREDKRSASQEDSPPQSVTMLASDYPDDRTVREKFLLLKSPGRYLLITT